MKLVFGHDYDPAIGLLQSMLPSLLLLAFTGIYSQVLFAIGWQRQVAVVAVIATLVNVLTNVILLPTIGAVGASIATVAAEAVTLILSMRLARRAFRSGATAIIAEV